MSAWCGKILDFIDDSSTFRSMDPRAWKEAASDQQNSDTYFCMEFPLCFDPRSTAQSRGEGSRPLGSLADYFSPDAKEHASMIFMIASRFSSTVCGWAMFSNSPSCRHVEVSVQKYLHNSWATGSMASQKNGDYSWAGACMGMRIASEVLKMQAEHLHRVVQRYVRVGDVIMCEQLWCTSIVQEVVLTLLDRAGHSRELKEGFNPSLFDEAVHKLRFELAHSRRSNIVERRCASNQVLNATCPRVSVADINFTPGLFPKSRFSNENMCNAEFEELKKRRLCGGIHPCDSAHRRDEESRADSEPPFKRKKLRSHDEKPHILEKKHARDIVTMRNILLNLPIDNDRFDLEMAESDNEDNMDIEEVERREKVAPRVDGEDRKLSRESILDADLQVWFSEILSQHLVPSKTAPMVLQMLLHHDDNSWIHDLVLKCNSGKKALIRRDLNSCEQPILYGTHLKVLTYIETQYAIREALETRFPSVRNDKTSYVRDIMEAKQGFLGVEIKKRSACQLVINLKCTSVDPSLNMKIVREIAGMSLCISYFHRHSQKEESDMQLAFVRSVHYDPEDYSSVDQSISKLHLRLVLSRGSSSKFNPLIGDYVYLSSLLPFAMYHREFRSSHDICRAPARTLGHIYGPQIPQRLGSIPSFSTKPRDHPDFRNVDRAKLRSLIDESSLKYVDKALSIGELNLPQAVSMEIVLAEISCAKKKTGSISQIQGPPGTGKTRCIRHLVGALAHMKSCGHVGFEGADIEIQENGSKLFKHGKRESSTAILVCAPKNSAVDKICEDFIQYGVLDAENDGNLFLDIVRVGRNNHDYGDLKPYSIHAKVNAYKERLIAEKSSGDKDSTKEQTDTFSESAQRKVVSDIVVYFVTNSSSGGTHFNNLRGKCSFVIMDEAANCSEPGMLVPISSMLNRMDSSHAVLVGDHKQLGPLSKGKIPLNMLNAQSKKLINFNIKKTFRSGFERLFTEHRTAASILTLQMRMHPAIGRIQSRPFYGDQVQHPDVQPHHLACYNQPSVNPLAFHPLTFYDTSPCLSRRETKLNDTGDFVNYCEAREINKLLFDILKATDGFEVSLKGSIAVLAPYKTQVAHVETHLSLAGNFLSNPSRKRELDVLFTTVDGLQGRERDIVLITTVRSNRNKSIGFLGNSQRLNVMTSRAKKLLILVGDSTTMENSKEWKQMWDVVNEGMDGSNILFAEPSDSDKDLARLEEVRKIQKRIAARSSSK